MSRHRKGATRKVEQERRYGPVFRRIGMFVGSALLLAAATNTGLWLWEPANLPVKSVLIQGEMAHVSREALRQAVTPHVEDGFLRVDISTIRQAVEALPWVHHAAVRRKWPSTLMVEITEQRALARWGKEGLVNPEGGMFTATAEGALATLPLLHGPTNSQKLLVESYREMQRMLKPVGLHIDRLELTQRRAWQLTLDNGITLLLGRKESYPRLLRFVRVYPRVLAKRTEQIKRIDLRYTNGFAVRWREGAATA